MITLPCPSEERLWRYVDNDLSPKDARVVERHVAECDRCRAEHSRLRGMLEHLSHPQVPTFDRKAHVKAVMARLDGPRLPSTPRRTHTLLLLGLSLAATALLVVLPHPRLTGTFQARGGGAAGTLGRDVGVQPYATQPSLRALGAGSVIRRDTPLTATFRNLGERPVYLLLFAVDSAGALHWITPSYERIDRDPIATALPSSTRESLLPVTVQFDDLALGALRIVSVINPEPAHVSDMERIKGALTPATIQQRLPHAEVREVQMIVSDNKQAKP